MEVMALNNMIGLSVEYENRGTRLKRNVKAGKQDRKGNVSLLVDTESDQGMIDRQWVDMRLFQSWLNNVTYSLTED